MTGAPTIILLADDERHIRTLVRMTLGDVQNAIVEATDGAAAVELAEPGAGFELTVAPLLWPISSMWSSLHFALDSVAWGVLTGIAAAVSPRRRARTAL